MKEGSTDPPEFLKLSHENQIKIELLLLSINFRKFWSLRLPRLLILILTIFAILFSLLSSPVPSPSRRSRVLTTFSSLLAISFIKCSKNLKTKISSVTFCCFVYFFSASQNRKCYDSSLATSHFMLRRIKMCRKLWLARRNAPSQSESTTRFDSIRKRFSSILDENFQSSLDIPLRNKA